MIIIKLSEILGRKKLKISDVIRETGVTRPTLTSLYYGKGNGISFDTLNSLCRYLKVGTDDLIKFYDIDIDSTDIKLSKKEYTETPDSSRESIKYITDLYYLCTVTFKQRGLSPVSASVHVIPADFRLIDVYIELNEEESVFTRLFPPDVRDVIIHKIVSSVYVNFTYNYDEKADIGKIETSFLAKE